MTITTSLVLVLFVIVIFVPSLALATNESSYQYGFEKGKAEFQNCQTEADCYSAQSDCSVAQGQSSISNMTACIHGYGHGWEHSCAIDGKACVWLFTNYGLLPDGSHIKRDVS